MSRTSAPLCLIAGAGDVGGRLARLRAAQGDAVLAVRRRETAALPGVLALQADLATGRGLQQLPRELQTLVFCAAPDQRNESAYRALYVDGVRRLLDRVDCQRLVFVSSTAVYDQDAGEWVDESTPARPPRFNGEVLLAAEAVVAGHPGGIVLRCSGLYGPGREAMLDKARRGEPGRRHWSNRIHVEDAAQALAHLLDLPEPQRLYLGNDDQPTLECELLDWLRARAGLPAVGAVPVAESGRRISNRRLRESGWLPVHPDFRSGYAAFTG